MQRLIFQRASKNNQKENVYKQEISATPSKKSRITSMQGSATIVLSQAVSTKEFGNSSKFHMDNMQQSSSGRATHQVPTKATSTVIRPVPKRARIATKKPKPVERVMKSKTIQRTVVSDSSEKDDLETLFAESFSGIDLESLFANEESSFASSSSQVLFNLCAKVLAYCIYICV